MRKLFLSVCFVFCAICAFAQWTSDPSKNTVIITGDSSNIYPLTGTTTDGFTYISWYASTIKARFEMRMQLLDPNGKKMWDSAGIVVSDYPQDSAVFVSNLAIDHDNNAIIAFQDKRSGRVLPVVYKVDRNGNLLWGSAGIQLDDSSGTYFQAAPFIGIFDNNDMIIAWSAESNSGEKTVAYQRINSDGTLPWGTNREIKVDSLQFSRGQPLTMSDGSFLMSYVNESKIYPFDGNVLANHFDGNGNPLWSQPTQVSDQTILYYLFASLLNDHHHGMYIAYSGDSLGSSVIVTKVQHVDSNGVNAWGAQGIRATTLEETDELLSGFCYTPNSEDIAISLMLANIGQTAAGMNVQILDGSGNRQLGDTGKTLIPLRYDTLPVPMTMVAADTGLIIVYFESGAATPYNETLKAMKVNVDGNIIWNRTLSLLNGIKSNVNEGTFLNNQVVIVWENDGIHPPPTPDTSMIVAQNISGQGKLGVIPVGIENVLLPSPFATVFPSLTHSMITIAFAKNATNAELEIMDVTGKMLLQKTISGKTEQIDISSWPTGFYLYHLRMNKQMQSGKLCKVNE